MMDWGDGRWSWWLLPMMMFMVVLVGAIVGAIVAYARPAGESPRSPTSPSPEQILGERFARGEIDVAEYDARIDALHRKPTATKS